MHLTIQARRSGLALTSLVAAREVRKAHRRLFVRASPDLRLGNLMRHKVSLNLTDGGDANLAVAFRLS